MPSRGIYGKPGGGKSFWTTWRVILNELLTSERYIVTNVVLRVEAWVPYLVSIGREDIDFASRVLLIGDDNVRINHAIYGDDEVKNFWRFRSPELVLPSFTDQQIKEGALPDIPVTTSVHYVLDELHEHLNSRQWMKTGPLLLWYIAKHRHFGDDVTWITQSVPNVDKQWRSVTQDYTEVRNYGKEKFRGLRKGNKFEAVTFLEYDPAGKLTPQETVPFKLDMKLANLYYTSVKGGEADKSTKLKGIHIYWLYAGVAAACIALALGFMFVPKWIGKKMGDSVKPVPGVALPNSAVAQVGTQPRNFIESAPLETPDLAGQSENIHVVGIPLLHVTADKVTTAFPVQNAGVSSIVGNASNTAVIVSGTSLQSVMSFAEAARQFDQQSGLVTVEAVVARLVKGRGVKYGLYDFMRTAAYADAGGFGELLDSLAWDASAGVVTFGAAPLARHALQAITDFESSGYRFEVVSRPSLSVLSGSSAEFASGRQIPVPVTVSNDAGTQTSVKYEQAEFLLAVSPTILPDGRVRLVLSQSNSDVLSNSQLGGNTVPTLSTQRLKTFVDIRPGQVGYLGGLTYRTARRDRRGVPVFGDIPGLSLLFATKDNGEEVGELILFVTVSVASDGIAGPAVRKAQPFTTSRSSSSWLDDTSTLSPVPTGETGQVQQTKGQQTQNRKKSKR